MNMKRMRGRNHRPNNNGGGGFRNQQNGIPLNRNHVFDSSGPEMRLRGTAQQLHEKYTQLARDASSNGDRVTGEAYYQHAEHYFRIISAINQAQGSGQSGPQPHNGNAGGYQTQEFPQRDGQNGDGAAEIRYAQEPRGQEPRNYEPRQPEQRQQDYRQQESRPNEHRPQEARPFEPRRQEPRGNQEPRGQESRGQESRGQEQRGHEQRNEQRSFEPRNRPDYQPRHERFQPESAIADTRIDISSALEAELAAAAAAPAAPPVATQPVATPRPAALEARAIPIIPDAPPAAEAPKLVRPRGRPRMVRPVPKDDAAD